MNGAARAFFEACLFICPRDFRRIYCEQMHEHIGDTVAEASARGGFAAGIAALVTACLDVAFTGLRERSTMIGRDLAYAVRTVHTEPLFAGVVIATLAIAIGANAAIFSVVNGVLIKPLPYPEPQQLLAVSQTDRQHTPGPWSYPNFTDVARSNRSFQSIAAFTPYATTLMRAGKPRSVPAESVTDQLFTVTGTAPERGRFFAPADARRTAVEPVVISDRLWRDAFDGDAAVIGRQITLNGAAYAVIGVAPPDFVQPVVKPRMVSPDLWTIVHPSHADATDARDMQFLWCIGRLKPAVTADAANADVHAIMANLSRRYPAANRHTGGTTASLADVLTGSVRPLLVSIFVTAAGLLLVACANVANLLLSRAATRERELALRYAIGASHSRIVAQMLTETLVYATLGGLLGMAVAIVVVDAVVTNHTADIPRLSSVTFDAGAALYTIGIAAAATLLAGLVPALTVSRIRLGESLKAAGRGSGPLRGTRLRAAFVVAEIAITLALVFASVLVTRSFFSLTGTALGISPQNVTVARAAPLPERRYRSDASLVRFQSRVIDGERALDGIEDAAWAAVVPFSHGLETAAFTLPEERVRPGDERSTNINVVSSGFFNVLGIPLVRGRLFNDADTLKSPQVVIVSETFARQVFGTLDVIGRRVVPDAVNDLGHTPPPRTIVGVAADMRETYAGRPHDIIYLPITQVPISMGTLIVRTSPGADPNAIAGILPAFDPLLDRPQLTTLTALMADDAARARLSATALAILASLALLLAIAGVYAVVSYSVAQRTHEIGVRIALGARSGHIVRTVIARVLGLATLGIAIGLVLATLATPVLATQLYGIGTLDALTYAGVVLLLAGVAAIAALVPALRAARVNPMAALRTE